ncbi:MAG TPA: heme biosynthesis HemY N-terminal domain-containing protein [Gallionella sp.]|jgi:HemY protein|nr:heme biosynthesis HemY N-terminal domain-containing protein [Gallionella sp.]
MKYLLWLLSLFAAAVALSTAAHNAAYVLLVYPPYRIELSLTLFIILLVSIILSGYTLLRLTLAATQLPGFVRKFRRERAQAKARKLLNEALGAFFEGHYAAAEKASARAMELGDTSALHPIIAARSAHELREYEKRDAYLSAAEDKTIGDSTMRLMASAKFMIDQRNPKAALHSLRELRDSGIKSHPGALSLELKAQQQAGNWDEVLDVLDQLEKRKFIDVTAAAQLRQQAWLEKIRVQGNLEDLTACLKSIPDDFKRRGKIAAAAARALARHGGCLLAQQLLSNSLNAQWDSELVALYGDCVPGEEQSGGIIAQIEQAEKWLNQHKNDAGLLLALGKLCLHQKLWGKAQNYLDASASIAPNPAVFTTLGQLAERLGQTDEAAKYYQQAMTAMKAGGE